jgi:hypothetical protein
MTSNLKMATVQEKAMCLLWFFEAKSVFEMQHRCRTQYGNYPTSDKAIQLRLKQFQETGNVLHRKGAGRPSTVQEDVGRMQEAFSPSPQKSTGRASLQLGIAQTTFWRVVHSTGIKIVTLSYSLSSFILLFPV